MIPITAAQRRTRGKYQIPGPRFRSTNLAFMESGREKQWPQIKSFQRICLSVSPLESKNCHILGKRNPCLSSCPSCTVVSETHPVCNCHFVHTRARMSLHLYVRGKKTWTLCLVGLISCLLSWSKGPVRHTALQAAVRRRMGGKGKQHVLYFHKWSYCYEYETQNPLLT